MDYLPLHWSIFAVDIEGFSESYRDDRARISVRSALHRVLEESFHAAGLSMVPEHYEGTGDGAVILVSPLVPKVLLIDPLLGCLSATLAAHNRRVRLAEQFRLRCALHAGEVTTDPHGMSGIDLVLACRLLDAAELRTTLAHSPVDVATIVSDVIYQAVVRHGYRDIDPTTYHPVPVRVKHNHISAWIHLPGDRFGDGSASRAPSMSSTRIPRRRPVHGAAQQAR